MGRAPCCAKVGLHRGPWTAREDALLTNYIQCHGEGNWRSLPKKAGLLRCGKSCRLRWMNYLRPDIKRGNIGPEEEDLIIRLHSLLGNRWSLIAGRLPGRTDNEIKNYWNSHLSKKLKRQGVELRGGTTKPCTNKRSNSKSSSSRTATKNENKKKLPIIQEEEGEDAPKTKIHAPKPTRLTLAMRNRSNATTETSQGSDPHIESNSSEDERGDVMSSWPEVVDNINEGGLFVDSDHMHGSQSYCSDGMDCEFQYELLDRLYQEYSHLLTADPEDQFPLFSFTESLLQ